ncbi:hypothetical protein SNE32_16115, partial [Lysobacter sp. D1-1-M9]|uniref:hypothetical protein n=1 Tax=Novilysobacter longmucuonensis TaxID=3098603 RepID=UPI002FC5B41F
QLATDVAGKASQQALDAVSNTVTSQGNTLSAQQDALTALNQQIGDVSQSAFNSLSNTVSTQGQQVSANQTNISGLTTTVGEQSASISQVSRIAASGVSGNGVTNPSFEVVSGGVPVGWSLSGGAFLQSVYYNTGTNAIRINGAGGALNNDRIPVTPGTTLRLKF